LSDRSEAAAFRAAAFIAAMLTAAGTVPAQAADAPPGAASCSGCHPAHADADTPVPRLAGQNAGEIVAAMQAFRSGQRSATVMDRIAKGFSDDEVKAIAAWFETQP
jgi:cytochrome subunit of sulfide dehydrogenase